MKQIRRNPDLETQNLPESSDSTTQGGYDNPDTNFESRFLRVLEDLLYLMDVRKPKEVSRITSATKSALQLQPAPILQLKKRG